MEINVLVLLYLVNELSVVVLSVLLLGEHLVISD